MAKVDLKECSKCVLRGRQFKVPIGDKPGARRDWFGEVDPTKELSPWRRVGLAPKLAVDLVDFELVRYEEVGDEYFVARATRATEGYLG